MSQFCYEIPKLEDLKLKKAQGACGTGSSDAVCTANGNLADSCDPTGSAQPGGGGGGF